MEMKVEGGRRRARKHFSCLLLVGLKMDKIFMLCFFMREISIV